MPGHAASRSAFRETTSPRASARQISTAMDLGVTCTASAPRSIVARLGRTSQSPRRKSGLDALVADMDLLVRGLPGSPSRFSRTSVAFCSGPGMHPCGISARQRVPNANFNYGDGRCPMSNQSLLRVARGAAVLTAPLAVGLGDALAGDARPDTLPVHYNGLLNDHTPSAAVVKGGPYEMRGKWSLEVDERKGTARFSAAMDMQTS